MKKLLITGFDPFGGAAVNPSWLAVWELPDVVGDYELCKLEIPTVFAEATRVVLKKAAQFQPDVILCVGQAGGRAAVTPERIGVNIRDGRICDNAGNQPKGEFVVEDGPAAYLSTVPVGAMAIMSRPSIIRGKVFICTGVMSVKPIFSTAFRISALSSPASENFMVCMFSVSKMGTPY